jgi:hypothetical protein
LQHGLGIERKIGRVHGMSLGFRMGCFLRRRYDGEMLTKVTGDEFVK